MLDIKAIKARHAAGMDTRQSAHQDREDLLSEEDRENPVLDKYRGFVERSRN